MVYTEIPHYAKSGNKRNVYYFRVLENMYI
jgi:hypothetical protein